MPLVVVFPLLDYITFMSQVVQEYERAVIFRLGRLVSGGARGPGIFIIIPCIDTYSKADLRTVSFDVPPQEVSCITIHVLSLYSLLDFLVLVIHRERGRCLIQECLMCQQISSSLSRKRVKTLSLVYFLSCLLDLTHLKHLRVCLLRVESFVYKSSLVVMNGH